MGIRGLLPPAIETLDQQMARVLDQMRTKRTTIGQVESLTPEQLSLPFISYVFKTSLGCQFAEQFSFLMFLKKKKMGNDVIQYIYLSNLRQSNVNLFYHVLLKNTSEVVPLVYTPVVGEACIKWSVNNTWSVNQPLIHHKPPAQVSHIPASR
jgi:malate dehydrogenase (oxaloacetate-decarboxylating)(NADP+)